MSIYPEYGIKVIANSGYLMHSDKREIGHTKGKKAKTQS
jgi:hypothetical protein